MASKYTSFVSPDADIIADSDLKESNSKAKRKLPPTDDFEIPPDKRLCLEMDPDFIPGYEERHLSSCASPTETTVPCIKHYEWKIPSITNWKNPPGTDWKTPSITNWKNPPGFIIPLNEPFVAISDSLYKADIPLRDRMRKCRDDRDTLRAKVFEAMDIDGRLFDPDFERRKVRETNDSKMEKIIALQSAEGPWKLSEDLLEILELDSEAVDPLIALEFPPQLLGTALCISFIELNSTKKDREHLELVLKKATSYVYDHLLGADVSKLLQQTSALLQTTIQHPTS